MSECDRGREWVRVGESENGSESPPTPSNYLPMHPLLTLTVSEKSTMMMAISLMRKTIRRRKAITPTAVAKLQASE